MGENEQLLKGLASIFVLGMGAQWLAAKLRIPSIPLLLTAGFVAGPVCGWIDPAGLMGDLLFPVVSLSVGLILFEGGLSLRFDALRQIGGALAGLLTIGVVVTFALTSVASELLLGLDRGPAVLLGAILVVTGPTVIGPMLRYIRPMGRVGPIAQWEGIVVDPIGATLAVLVFEAHRTHSGLGLRHSAYEAAIGLLLTVLAGIVCGTASAQLLLVALRRFWIPDRLQSPVMVAVVAATLTLANSLRPEAGLLAVTVMGIVLANQKRVAIGHIAEFKENLSVLLISSLFILLSARLSLSDLTSLGFRGIAFVLFLIVIVRPLAVWISTIGWGLTWQERTFLSWFAPRGIVAASVSSVFALRMGEAGDDLVPATFVVIVGTVLVYGMTAFPLARKLGLAVLDPQGLLMASAHPGARAIAHAVQDAGFRVVLLDSDRGNVNAARMEGLDAVQIDLLEEDLVEELDLGGLGRFLALTSNDEVNALSTMRFREVFGSREVYQLTPAVEADSRPDASSLRARGRLLFGPGATYQNLDDRFEAGAVVKRTKLSAEFDYALFRAHYGEQALPLFVIDAASKITVCTIGVTSQPSPGQTLICLVPPIEAEKPLVEETGSAERPG